MPVSQFHILIVCSTYYLLILRVYCFSAVSIQVINILYFILIGNYPMCAVQRQSNCNFSIQPPISKETLKCISKNSIVFIQFIEKFLELFHLHPHLDFLFSQLQEAPPFLFLHCIVVDYCPSTAHSKKKYLFSTCSEL